MVDGKWAALLKITAAAVLICTLSFFLKGFEYVLLLLCAAAIHEAGHLFFAKVLRVKLVRRENSFLHLSYKFDFSASSYLAEIVVSLAGAGFNIIFAFLTVALLKRQSHISLFFIFSNISLALFNLMPVSALDGSGALRAFLALPLGYDKAEKVTKVISFVFSAAFFTLSIYIQLKVGANFSLMAIAIVMLCSCMEAGKIQ